MFRTPLGTLSVVAILLAACGGAAAPTQAPAATTPGNPATTAPAAATTPPAAATTPASQATSPPQGGGTVVATLTGGAHAGSYTGNANPNCSFGFLSPGVWGVSYGEADMTEGLTGVVITAQPGPSAGEWSAQTSVVMDNATTYTVSNIGGAPGSAVEVTDNGSTATIHVTGPTIDNSGSVDLIVNCPSVVRP